MYYVLFVFAMLTPVLMAVVGLIWRIHPPKRDGGFLAYRTALSSKTEETWAFAHRHISKLWLRIGLLLSILSACLWLCSGRVPPPLYCGCQADRWYFCVSPHFWWMPC